MACTRGEPKRTPREETPLGEQLPAVQLSRLSGEPVFLSDVLKRRAAVVYVFGLAECASCSNLPLEFQILRREAPGVATLLVASGASVDSFRPRILSMGLADNAVVDEKRKLLGSLGIGREPLVLVVDSTGRILLVDTRSASRAAQYPMGHLLRDLRGVVAPTQLSLGK